MLIRPATLDDVQGISELLAKYYIGRLNDAQKARGFISVEFSVAELEDMVREPGAVVGVEKDGTVVAVAGSSSLPSKGSSGISSAISSLLGQIEFNGQLLSDYKTCMYGPVCVDESCAGQGMSARLWQAFKEMQQGIYDVGVSFISYANPTSIRSARDKQGRTIVADFEHDGQRFALLAFGIPLVD